MFVTVNGVKIYYEKSGCGQPLIMLHGNGESHSIFNKAVSVLKNSFTVYTVDFRNHGQSTRVESYSYSDHVKDIYELINILEIEKPWIYGFSDGGIVGIMFAIEYPDLLERLIVSGPNITPDGVKPFYFHIWQIMYKLTKSANFRLMLTQPQIAVSSLAQIKTKTYLTGGSRDIISYEHMKLISQNIPDCEFRIFKHRTHSNYIVNSTVIADYILQCR